MFDPVRICQILNEEVPTVSLSEDSRRCYMARPCRPRTRLRR